MGNKSSSLSANSRETKTISLLGSSSLLTQDGNLVTVEELAGNYGEAVKIAFRAPHGRVKFKTVRNFRPSDITVKEVTKIYLSNGHVLTATEYDRYVTADGEVVEVSKLTVDDSLSVLCYNPRTKFLSSTVEKISTYLTSSLPKGPQFLYDLDFSSEECLPLLSGSSGGDGVSCVTYSSILTPDFK